jgi:long-chain fatty acid transport protein
MHPDPAPLAPVGRPQISMTTHPFSRFLSALVRTAALAIAVSPALALAGGMALTMQNGAHLGQAFSAGASAEDASTVYTNPAGMAWLQEPELAGSVCRFSSSGGFTNTGSSTGGMLPTSGGNGGTALASTLVPTLYYAQPISDGFAAGFGLSVPFGLATDYDAGWVGRYHALESTLTTLDLAFAISWRASDRIALGAGFDWQRADAELTNAIDFGLLGFLAGAPGFVPGGADGFARVDGGDTSTGFNLGLLVEPMDGTRVGLHFRSRMNHRLSGRATFTSVPLPFAAAFTDQTARAPLALPEILSLSLHHDLSHSLAITADWSWWNWSVFDALVVDFENPATPDTALAQHWKDASIWSAGLRWRRGEKLTVRAGLAWNETPVRSAALRSPRIPDSDRLWLGLGLSWAFAENGRADFGCAHLFVRDSSTAFDDGAGHLLAGTYAVGVDILSAQLVWRF